MSAALFKKAKQKALYLAILGMFSNNVPGLVLDSNDWGPTGTGGTGVVFQDLEATSVTAMEQPVQLILDKNQNLALGPELITNGDFSNGTTGWSAVTSNTLSVVSGTGKAVSSVADGAWFGESFSVVAGKTYKFQFDCISDGTSVPVRALLGSANGTSNRYTGTVSAFGAKRTFYYVSPNTETVWLWFYGGTGRPIGNYILIDNVSCRSIAGNHAYVSASANRPTISARYNLYTKTESIKDWSTSNCTVDPTPVAGPDGKVVAYRATFAANGVLCQNLVPAAGSIGNFTQTAYVKSATGSNQTIRQFGNGGTTYSNEIVVGASWIPIKFQYAFTATTSGFTTASGGTADILICYPDIRPSDQATGLIPTYQRVNTATDYDTVGFPVREAYNGSNQLLGGASGGGATTGFFFCAGVMITKVGAAQTLFSDAGTNTGWRVRINASNQLELSAGNGTAYTTVATVGTVSINKLTVVTAWHDGTNLNVQINQGAVAQAAFAVATAGTAGYTLGCDNGASTNYLQGSLGEIVYRTGTAMNAAQIAATQAFVNSKQKAY